MKEIKVNEYLSYDFQVTESIKTLRTNLIFSGEDIKAVGITSCNKNEGKSTVALLLASSLARAGKKVILLEADLRAGVLQKSLHVREKLDGLSHYLTSISKKEDLIYPTDIKGLNIMFAGQRVVSSAELLGSVHFEELIKQLKEDYDYIIVDSAPLGEIVDYAVIAPKLDGTIILIDVNHNHYKTIKQVKNQLEMAGAKILGVVLNKVEIRAKKGSYAKKGYYGYGYNTDDLRDN